MKTPTTPAQEAKRIINELETLGLQFAPTQTYPGIWYAALERFSGKKLVKDYQRITGKTAEVYNVSGGTVLLYGQER